MIVFLFCLRAALWLRVPPFMVGIATALGTVLLMAAGLEWFAFKPLFQGRGAYVDQQIAKIVRADGRDLELLFEDGSTKHARQGAIRSFTLQDGQCLTVEWFRGRLGVMWIEFQPRPAYPGRIATAPDACFPPSGA